MKHTVFFALVVLLLISSCSPSPSNETPISPTNTVPPASPTDEPGTDGEPVADGDSDTIEEEAYIFSDKRTAYRLDLSEDGTNVIHRQTGETVTVPYGEEMVFATYSRTSKDTSEIIHNVRSHVETYAPWEEIADLPVDYLRTGLYATWDGMTPQQSISAIETCPFSFPDRSDKVVVAYVNLMEFTKIGNWDSAFDPTWDANNDNLIDAGLTDLPDYVDTKVFNEAWVGYVAAYWTDSWKEVLQKRVDLAAAENFDGVMFDVMTGYWTWMDAYPGGDVEDYRQKMVTLIKDMSEYAKSKYGTAFLITANLDWFVYLYFDDLGSYVDGGYFQNAYFDWDGSGNIGGGIDSLDESAGNPLIEFMAAQGLSLLDMDHLGTGQVTPGLDFENYDDRISEENWLLLFRWAAESGSLPYATRLFMDSLPYNGIPRFSRVIPGKEAFGNTPYDDWVLGSDAVDVVLTGDGADLFYGGPGNDHYEGGAGNDTALFNGNSTDYTVSHDENGVTTVTDNTGQEGVDTLIDVERLIFNDLTMEIP
jgi:Ca2+-binding RTX toxin-like protein